MTVRCTPDVGLSKVAHYFGFAGSRLSCIFTNFSSIVLVLLLSVLEPGFKVTLQCLYLLYLSVFFFSLLWLTSLKISCSTVSGQEDHLCMV